MKKIISKKSLFTSLLSLGVLCLSQATDAAWTNPTAGPATFNVAAPINAGGMLQNKVGSFGSSGSISAAGALSAGVLVTTPSLRVTSGAIAGRVLTSDAAGNATWVAPAAGADNLGNHLATTTLNLDSNNISNVNGLGVNVLSANYLYRTYGFSGSEYDVNDTTYYTDLNATSKFNIGSFNSLSVGGSAVCQANGVNCQAVAGDNLGAGNTGTASYLTKWTGAGSTIGNSQVYDNGTNVGIGTSAPVNNARLTVVAAANNYSIDTDGPIKADGGGSFGVWATSTTTSLYGSGGSYGVYGGGSTVGVYGVGTSAYGVYGVSNDGVGVRGKGVNGSGGYFASDTGYALITGSGNVGIGTSAPTVKLDVNGGANVSGNVGIGTATPLSKLTVNGNGAANISIYGRRDTGYAIYGGSLGSGTGIFGGSNTGVGVYAQATVSGVGLYAVAPVGYNAAVLNGNVDIYGKLYLNGDLQVNGTTTLTCPCGTCWAMQGFDAGCGMAPSFGGYRMCTPGGWRDTYPGVGGC